MSRLFIYIIHIIKLHNVKQYVNLDTVYFSNSSCTSSAPVCVIFHSFPEHIIVTAMEGQWFEADHFLNPYVTQYLNPPVLRSLEIVSQF